MRIGMILDSEFPPDPRVENEAKALIKEDYEVFLFCLSYQQDFKKNENISGIEVRRHYCNKLTYKLSALAYTLPFYHMILKSKIHNFIKDHQIDVIHVHDMQVAGAVWKLKSKLKQPVIIDLHENRPEIMKFYTHVKSFWGKLLINPLKWKKRESHFIKTADHVIVVTNSAKDLYQNQLNISENKFNVVPNVVRKAFYENFKVDDSIINKFSNSFNFLYLGETGARRGTFDIIDAAAVLKNKGIEFKLIMVGKSKDDKLLKEYAKREDVFDCIYFEGWQRFDLFQSYLSVADVGLSCLHRNIHHDTTFANKVFQYASFGVPIIASDCIAQKEVIEEMNAGLIYKASNIEALTSCMEKLYKNEVLKAKLGENGKKGVDQNYNWENKSKELIRMYKKIEASAPT